MREYRQRKRQEILGTGGVVPKIDYRSSTHRSRDFRARVANSILSSTPTTSLSTAIPNMQQTLEMCRQYHQHLNRMPSTSISISLEYTTSRGSHTSFQSRTGYIDERKCRTNRTNSRWYISLATTVKLTQFFFSKVVWF